MATFIVSDFHGNLTAWNLLKNALKENDRVFVLGDACDRGPHGVEILLDIMNDPRFTYILGNHDDFMIRTLAPQFISRGSMSFEAGWQTWKYNHGSATIKDMHSLKECCPRQYNDLVDWLVHQYVYCTVMSKGQKYHLAHAKFPKHLSKACMTWRQMEQEYPKVLHSAVWDRYTSEENNLDSYITPGAMTIIGHTPVNRDNHVVCLGLINIDTGLGKNLENPEVMVICLENRNIYMLSQAFPGLPSVPTNSFIMAH